MCFMPMSLFPALFFFLMLPRPPRSTLFPYTMLFRSHQFQYDVFSRGRIGAGVQTLINVNPPLWFMEGMAEYLSLGPIDNHTAMLLRDASLEGHLPTIEQLTYDPRIFPYYFGTPSGPPS